MSGLEIQEEDMANADDHAHLSEDDDTPEPSGSGFPSKRVALVEKPVSPPAM